MDINLLQEHAKLAYDHAIAKKNLAERIQARMNISYNDGYFTVTEQLISFLSSWDDETLILIDSYQKPIKVNRLELLHLCQQRYRELLNEWHEEWQELKKVRNANNV